MRGARTRWAVAAVLLAASLAVVGAGCGGGGSSNSSSNGAPTGSATFSDYETAMQALGHSLGTALSTAGTANRNASRAKIIKNLQKSQSELRAAAVKLEKITPPDRIKAQQELLVKGVLLYAAELGTVIKHVQGTAGVGALSEIGGLAGVAEMGRASAAIQKAGYVIVDR